MEKYVERFLLASLFGSDYGKPDSDPVTIAIRRAYRDFCRTIRDKNNPIISNLEATFKATRIVINQHISSLLKGNKDYDEWHKILCAAIVEKGYTFGQAQKWVNMTMKYLIVLDYAPVFKYFDYLHVPIDTIVINNAIDNKIIDEVERERYLPWSTSLNNNDDHNYYGKFQSKIRRHVEDKHISPIEWEFGAWNEK